MRRHRRIAVLVAAVLGTGGLLIPAPAQSEHNTALKNALRAQAFSRISGGTFNGGTTNGPPAATVAAPACGRISVRLSLIEARLRSRGLIAAANRIAAVRVRLCSSP